MTLQRRSPLEFAQELRAWAAGKNPTFARELLIHAAEDLERLHAPAQQAHDPLLAALKDAADALASLDIDALGWAADGNSCWPIRDELLKKISDALAPYTTNSKIGE